MHTRPNALVAGRSVAAFATCSRSEVILRKFSSSECVTKIIDTKVIPSSTTQLVTYDTVSRHNTVTRFCFSDWLQNLQIFSCHNTCLFPIFRLRRELAMALILKSTQFQLCVPFPCASVPFQLARARLGRVPRLTVKGDTLTYHMTLDGCTYALATLKTAPSSETLLDIKHRDNNYSSRDIAKLQTNWKHHIASRYTACRSPSENSVGDARADANACHGRTPDYRVGDSVIGNSIE